MTYRLPLIATLLASSLAAPLAAQGTMTDAEREAFRAEVRAYLLDNPEVLIEAYDVLEARQADAQAAEDAALLAANRAAIRNDPASWVGGNPEGDVTLVEFIDYRCGYCRKAQEEVAELVRVDGNIRLIIKEYPILGEESLLSSRFAIAVLQTTDAATYQRAHDALIAFRGDVTPATLRGLAERMGLDAPAILARMDAPEVTAVIAANHTLARTLDISGTPTFVIEDTLLRGYVPLPDMARIVADERAG